MQVCLQPHDYGVLKINAVFNDRFSPNFAQRLPGLCGEKVPKEKKYIADADMLWCFYLFIQVDPNISMGSSLQLFRWKSVTTQFPFKIYLGKQKVYITIIFH